MQSTVRQYSVRSCERKMADLKILQLVLLAIFPLVYTQNDQGASLSLNQEEKAKENHETDSLNILMFMSLLILTVLTIWLFKHRRFRFVHETGLGIIYGMLLCIMIKLG